MKSDFAEQLERYGPQSQPRPTLALADAQAYCLRLARTHYENFAVLTWLSPRALRPHLAALYAYCRWADDLADETASPEQSLDLLAWWRSELDACYAGQAWHPVFVALRETIARFELPREPLADLLRAFTQDQRQSRYANAEEVAAYCRYSAAPVGRLMLCLGVAVPQRTALYGASDDVCRGLQLANFCQDVARDYDLGRIYLPWDRCLAHGVDEATFAARQATRGFRELLAEEVARARGCLASGWQLCDALPPASAWLRAHVWLIVRGGLRILERIAALDYDVWTQRPRVTKLDQLRLLAAWGRARFFPPRRAAAARPASVPGAAR